MSSVSGTMLWFATFCFRERQVGVCRCRLCCLMVVWLHERGGVLVVNGYLWFLLVSGSLLMASGGGSKLRYVE